MVTRRFINIGILNPDFPDYPDLVKTVSVLHITALEDLSPTGPKHKSNGKKK
jgi:hypothetical protein